MKFIFTIWLLLIIFSPPIYSQNLLRFEHIGAKEGLSSQKVNCIFQDNKGFIWFGTDFGLNRFDGIRCRAFYHNPTDTTSLTHNIVLSVVQDSLHRLWIGTQEGVSVLDPLTNKFTNYSAKDKGNYFYPKENCHTFIDKDGLVWVGNNNGISFFDTQQQQFIDIPLQLGAPGSNRNRFATSFLHDSKDRLWVSTSYGVHQIDLQSKKITNFHFDDTPSGFNQANACRQIVEDRKGRIFVGTWTTGINYFDEQTRELVSIPVSPVFAENIISTIIPVVENNRDFLLLGSFGGLLKIETDQLFLELKYRHIEKNLPDKLNNESITHTSIYTLLLDRSGNLWAGTADGVSKADPLQQYFHHARLSKESFTEYSPDAITVTFDKKTYFIVAGPQLYRYNPNTFTVKEVDLFKDHDVGKIVKGQNYFWVGTNRGLFQCDTSLNVVRSWSGKVPQTRFMHINAMVEDFEGKLWFSIGKNGIRVLDPKSGELRQFLHDSTQVYNLTGQSIERIMEDKRHDIWIATSTGLIRYNRSTVSFKRYLVNDHPTHTVNNCLSLIETKAGVIWIGTKQGLNYYDEVQDKLVPYSLNNPEISDYIKGLKEDKESLLWLTTINGIIRLDPKTGQNRLFNSMDGLPSSELTDLNANESQKIFVGSPGMITMFDPLAIRKNNFVPPPEITNISVNNNTVVTPSRLLKIKYDQTISVDFVSLNFSNTSANQYAYQLKGVDKDWTMLGNNRSVRFSSLPPGKYTLKIKAANNDGVWNGQTTDLSFSVIPPFWKTWWFISLLAVFVVTVAFAFYRYRVAQLIQIEKMRMRIATDLHDDIGATLSSISFYSEAVKEQVKEVLPNLQPVLEKMGENSRNMVGSMSDIVWAIKPDNDEGEKLLQRMESYAKELCALKNVQLSFNTDKRIGLIKLTLEQRKNIYLLFKEALNNAMKYSDCSMVTVQALVRDSRIFLMIKDNGKGFDPAKVQKGNGLRNMTKRASEIQGKVEVITGEGAGTEIRLESPIA